MNPNAIIHDDFEQGSPEWHEARRGLLTASEMNLALTPTLKPSNNEKTRSHIFEIAAQRITKHTEPTYIGDAMLRGHADEITSRDLYSEHYEPVEERGFITRDFGGFTLGYSPDGVGVLGDFGIECKSRVQKHHIKTIISNEVPTEHMLQLQTGLLITEWDYIDYISYCGGMPLWVIRVAPIAGFQDAILEAGENFERQVQEQVGIYDTRTLGEFIKTEREADEQGIVFQ